MTGHVRLVMALSGVAGTAALLAWGIGGLPSFGEAIPLYGEVANALAVPAVHVTNAVAAVLFDIRALDTMGEEIILFAAGAGAVLLLREQREESEHAPIDEVPGRSVPGEADAVRVLCIGLFVVIAAFGLSTVMHGHLTPGGGFQGGALLASAVLVFYLAGEYELLERVFPVRLVEAAEALAAAAFVAVGLAAMAAGAAFLSNVLPLGRPGSLLSGGTVLLLNVVVGIEVAAAVLLIVDEFLHQTLEVEDE